MVRAIHLRSAVRRWRLTTKARRSHEGHEEGLFNAKTRKRRKREGAPTKGPAALTRIDRIDRMKGWAGFGRLPFAFSPLSCFRVEKPFFVPFVASSCLRG